MKGLNRDHKEYQWWRAQDGHLDFHTAPKLCLVIDGVGHTVLRYRAEIYYQPIVHRYR